MQTRKEVQKHVHSFSRPTNFNINAWHTLQKWAIAVWESKLACQTWHYSYTVTCKEAYQMICDAQGACIIKDERYLNFKRSASTQKWLIELIDLSTDLAEQGEYEEAIDHLKIAALISPDDHHVWNNLGVVYHSMKQYKSAFTAFAKAQAEAPAAVQIYVNRAALYQEVEWYEKACDDYDFALRLHGPNWTLAKKKFEAMFQARPSGASIAWLREQATYYANQVGYWTVLASGQLNVGSTQCALASIHKGYGLNPVHPDVIELKALIANKLKVELKERSSHNKFNQRKMRSAFRF